MKRNMRWSKLNFLTRNKEKLNYLKWWDILIITLIMFGYFIYSSTTSFFGLPDTNITQIPEFTNDANWQALILQLGLLAITFIYLYLSIYI